MTQLTFENEWMDWGQSGGLVRLGDVSVELSMGVMSFARRADVVAGIARAVEAGESLEAAVARPHRGVVHHLSRGIIVIDDTAALGADAVVDTLKTLTSLCAGSRRIIVLIGAIAFAGESDYDTLEAFGALMVRLNIAQVMAIGARARSIFLSVGREGSWAGESQHYLDAHTAYDSARAFIGPGDVVVVMGSSSESLFPLVDRFVEDLA
jgi:UDP-N-acetylmuramoyl-tripeptide--D-alanyl-D-alanine ligase